jgi:hypothetical protein
MYPKICLMTGDFLREVSLPPFPSVLIFPVCGALYENDFVLFLCVCSCWKVKPMDAGVLSFLYSLLLDIE